MLKWRYIWLPLGFKGLNMSSSQDYSNRYVSSLALLRQCCHNTRCAETQTALCVLERGEVRGIYQKV